MENVRDWCISRQLWWGQQIPAFYMEDGTLIVAKDKKEALRIARDKYQLFALVEDDLTQDPDVLDTWFSSWLWPISVFDGIENPNNEEINYYYPTNDLVTGPDILFFWVARMIMAGYEWRDELPFKNVYLTGIVRDKQGRKMSKSLGNSPDPLELIERFGADGVRSGLLFSAPAGNDLLFDEKLCEQGRNFSNKIWNAFRLLKGLEVVPGASLPEHALATAWFESKLSLTIREVQDHFSKFRISDALLSIYNLVWDAALGLFDSLMRLMHPYMPFITEEIWQAIDKRAEKASICQADFPKAGLINEALISQFDVMFEVVTKVREIRNSKQLSPKLALPICIKSDQPTAYASVEAIMQKLANLESIRFVSEAITDAQTFVVKSDQFFVPMENDEDPAVLKAESEKELAYQLGFKKSVEAKLANEKFVQNAKPELVERERQKLSDSENKIKSLQELLARLG
jgi:valyl-tRNA synthetase